jgi:serine/threonine protein kinase
VASGTSYASSPKVDIWALGIILYYMLFGKYPFEGSKDSEILDKIIKDDLQYPNDILISDSCYKLINSLLLKNPKHRIEMTDPLLEDWYNNSGSDSPIHIKKPEKRLSFAPNINKLVSESISPRKLERKTIKTSSITLVSGNNIRVRSNSTLVIKPIKSISNINKLKKK